MFTHEYQGAPFLEVLSAQGKLVTGNFQTGPRSQIDRSFDKDVKGNVFILKCSAGFPQLVIPSNRSSLGLIQSNLCLQINVPSSSDFSLDISVTDQSNVKRKLLVSTAGTKSGVSITPLHARIPMKEFVKGTWLTLCVDLGSLVSGIYPGEFFKSLDSITINAQCKLRRVFTLRDSPSTCGSQVAPVLPRNLDFLHGVKSRYQFFSFDDVDQVNQGTAALRTTQSAPKTTIAFGSKTPVRSQKNCGDSLNRSTASGGKRDALNTSGGESQITRTGAYSAPTGARGSKTHAVKPHPPSEPLGESRGLGSSSGSLRGTGRKLRARAYSDKDKEPPTPDASPDAHQPAAAVLIPTSSTGVVVHEIMPSPPVPEPAQQTHELFSFSSMPHPTKEGLKPQISNLVPPTARSDPTRPNNLQPTASESLPQTLMRGGPSVNADTTDEDCSSDKENSESTDPRTSARTPSDYDWRNYIAEDERSADSLEQSMLQSILDPKYHEHHLESGASLHHPLQGVEDLSIQSSKYTLTDSRGNSRAAAHAAMAAADIPSCRDARFAEERYSPPLLLEDDNPVEQTSNNAVNGHKSDDEVELLYDPVFKCYYDPRTHKYYELI